MKEIGTVGAEILPERLIQDSKGQFADPIESHHNLFYALHEKIDDAFSTDFARSYSPEAKTNDLMNEFTIGIVPLPSSGFLGKKGWELKNSKYQPTRNIVTNIDGRLYRGHALDQMQNRGIPPSVVEETLRNGKQVKTPSLGTVEYYDSANKIKVILNEQEEVITVIRINGE
jgi:uncharacterized protein DUF4258